MSTFLERDATEVLVSGQWSRVLGAPVGNLDADFFESGGNSLAAARFTAGLRRVFPEADLPLEVVFDARTFRAISSWLRKGHSTPNGRIVTLAEEGAGVPLLLLPSGGGGVVGLQALAGEPLDRPVYALQARGLNPVDGPPLRNLTDLVADFAEIVRARDLPRTIHLAGYCAGGIFAYELARTLCDEGWSVASVLLLNTSLHTPPATFEEIVETRLNSISESAGLGAKRSADAQQVFAELIASGADIVETDAAAFEARLHVYASLWSAAVGYRPQPADFPVRLFSTPDRVDPKDVTAVGHHVPDWGETGLQDFHCYEVSSGHFEMLRHRPTLQMIEDCLVEVEGRSQAVAPAAIASHRASGQPHSYEGRTG
ncbi:alpha/beta fold hydrolase [Streptomyces canus]|uniref:thioesterase domain-containing protein n=1 Tax=Streptomyces canus TaxID=58343 RepID=UPI00224E8DD1|nr:alpha/beta fold hydrolase [Streptomyces canus]MCX5256839.1 alpha/beta fold hydrolase [Streptomyces canus]